METLVAALKHVAKDIFKVGIIAYDVAADAVAHTTETIKDLAAEARAEVDGGTSNAMGTAPTGEQSTANGTSSHTATVKESVSR
ncbi:MAG TPA: hypothetical protein VJV04_11640 [Nitrospiraceae bacterium]|nr:hypothetical protein [Nitrospiraceae bacterium]